MDRLTNKHYARQLPLMLACVSTGAAGQMERAESIGRVAPVEWPAGGPTAASAATSLPAFKSSNKTLLPVLVPTPFLSKKSLDFVGEPASYTASVRVAKATLSITGTRIAFEVPGSSSATPSTQPKERSTDLGDRTASASYVRYGAAYRVDVECEHDSDKRCSSETYARSLLDSVELVGGSEGTPPQPAAPDEDQAGPTAASSITLPDQWSNGPGALFKGSGKGVTEAIVYSPQMRFPVAEAPAYLNSQVWGVGGLNGPRGSASDMRNYQYPWYDNFCETRSRATPMCPGGKGHQGQDIRPAGPGAAKYWAVATEDGRITRIGSYSVILLGGSGTDYRYLHLQMNKLAVKAGDRVKRGQKLGLISNNFGGTPTTVHLHFEMLQNVGGKGLRHVPPYTSLIAAYQQM